jgi:hypothetical protein
METLEHGLVELLQRSGGRRCEQHQRRPRVSGELLRAGGRERAMRAACRVGRERRGALEEGAGRRRPAPRSRAPGRLLELVRDVLVGPDSGVRAMPSEAIWIEVRVGGRRERPMRGASLVGRGLAVDRGPQERVAELDLQSEVKQPLRLRRSQLIKRDPEFRCSAHEQRRLTGRVARSHEQQTLRHRRQLLHAPPEARFDPLWQRSVAGEPEASRQRRERRSAWQLEQRKRIAARLGQYPVAHAVVHGSRDDRGKELPRRAIRQSQERQLWESGKLLEPAGLALCEQQNNCLRGKAPSHEREHLCRRPVEPLDVVDNAEHWMLLRHVGEQTEHSQPDEKAIRPRARAEAQRGGQGVTLGRR